MARVLVVDDSATMRKIIIKGLKGAGYTACEFLEAGDGLAGLELLCKDPVDLILSDINMPNMDGIQFVRCVRDQTALESVSIGDKELVKRVGNQVPIVMVTTEGGLGKVEEALSAGANDYLKKPFTPTQLAEKIAPLLDQG
jgi:two-component system chemotaxis response regulator CheY